MKNVLIVSGHTDLKNDSVANKTIINELKRLLPEAEYDILSDLYPDYRFNVKAEQEKLVKADIIVWQFPVFWYSMPSLLRKWIEDVVVHGFAYGSTGTALKGKRLIASFTTGALIVPQSVLNPDSPSDNSFENLLYERAQVTRVVQDGTVTNEEGGWGPFKKNSSTDSKNTVSAQQLSQPSNGGRRTFENM